jgi:hypothetical protein
MIRVALNRLIGYKLPLPMIQRTCPTLRIRARAMFRHAILFQNDF